MTLGMLKRVLDCTMSDLFFDFDSNIEIINENTGTHYRKLNGQMLLGGDPLGASEDWVLGLPVTHISVRKNNLVVMVDG